MFNKKMLLGVMFFLLAGSVIGFAGIKLTRGGYESPEYTAKKHAEGFEIRRYSGMTIVSTKKADPNATNKERDSRFMRLFQYIDKSNDKSEKIAMTTPVFMGVGGNEGEMSFVIPKEVVNKGAPSPNSDKLYVTKMNPTVFAAMRFRGKSSKEGAAAKKLTEKVEKAGLKIAKDAKPIFAYYDPPWIPIFLRKNEVLIQIKDIKK